jgi:hypothetical protein
MKRKDTLAVVLLVVLTLCAAPVSGVQKLKDKKKEKRFEPVVKQQLEEYAGRYIGMQDYYLEVRRLADGKLAIVSQEGGRRATLQNIHLDGARLTATRVYPDGTTKDFAATFVNRVLNGDIRFGIMVENLAVKFEGLTLDNIFYRLDSKR